MTDSFKGNWVVYYEHKNWSFVKEKVNHIKLNVRNNDNPTKEITYVYLGIRRHSKKNDDKTERQTWLFMVRNLSFIWILNYFISIWILKYQFFFLLRHIFNLLIKNGGLMCPNF